MVGKCFSIIQLFFIFQANAKYALAYDAILIYLMTIRNLLKKDLTITGQTISQQMRKVTKKVIFESTGNAKI